MRTVLAPSRLGLQRGAQAFAVRLQIFLRIVLVSGVYSQQLLAAPAVLVAQERAEAGAEFLLDGRIETVAAPGEFNHRQAALALARLQQGPAEARMARTRQGDAVRVEFQHGRGRRIG